MGKDSKIEWTHHTFNPWWGCAKVSPACDHCYAERDAGRYAPDAELWGVKAQRRSFGDGHWRAPVLWNAAAARNGERLRVFCASMADVFDKNAPEGARDRLWQLIDATPNLDWLLLTKRVGNASSMLPESWLSRPTLPHNVWLGISVCNQAEALRDLPKLLELRAWVHFLSVEPLLGAIDFEAVFRTTASVVGCCVNPSCRLCDGTFTRWEGPKPDWIIVGGESGPQARPMAPAWVDRIHTFCTDHEVPFFFKQWGEWAPRESFPLAALENGRTYPVVTLERRDLFRIGKKQAGRVYLQKTWDELPTIGGQ